MTLPPISASYDVAINNDISIGAYLGFAISEETFMSYTWTYTHIILGARGAYHFYKKDDIDAYGGLMIGYNTISIDEPSDWGGYGFEAEASGLTYSLFVGARYYFSNGIGAYAELGYGVAYLSVGVTFEM